MNTATDRILRTLEAVGHASRFRIVLALCERERHVSELALEIGLSQSCTTRHLQALERAEVIRTHRAGKRVLAALALERELVAQLVGWLRDAGAPDAYSQPAGVATVARRAPVAAANRAPRAPRVRLPEIGNDREQDPARVMGQTSDTPPPQPFSRRPHPSARASDLDDFLL